MDREGYREEERWKPRGCSSADSRCAEAVLGVVYRDEGKRSRDPRGIRVGSLFRCDRFEVASCHSVTGQFPWIVANFIGEPSGETGGMFWFDEEGVSKFSYVWWNLSSCSFLKKNLKIGDSNKKINLKLQIFWSEENWIVIVEYSVLWILVKLKNQNRVQLFWYILRRVWRSRKLKRLKFWRKTNLAQKGNSKESNI